MVLSYFSTQKKHREKMLIFIKQHAEDEQTQTETVCK